MRVNTRYIRGTSSAAVSGRLARVRLQPPRRTVLPSPASVCVMFWCLPILMYLKKIPLTFAIGRNILLARRRGKSPIIFIISESDSFSSKQLTKQLMCIFFWCCYGTLCLIISGCKVPVIIQVRLFQVLKTEVNRDNECICVKRTRSIGGCGFVEQGNYK